MPSVRKVIGWLIGCWLLAPAHAELVIEIRGGVEDPVPVAIVPFGWLGDGPDAPFDVAALVEANLERSGRFSAFPREQMIDRPTTGAEVDFSDWRLLATDVVLVGQLLETAPDNYDIRFQLFDIFRGQLLLGFRIPSTRNQLRATTHRISDMIFKELTGVEGIFSTRIAYVSEEGESDARRHRLVVADADGENARIITESPEPILSPSWSPDGRRLAYVSFENGQSAIYVQVLRTGNRQRVSARAGVNSAPAWSPDGRRLALVLSKTDGNLDLYTLDLSNQVLTRLTRHPAIDTEPCWSADGRELFFTSDRSGGPQVYRVSDTPGGRPKRVTFEGDYNARPRMSPDQSQLALVHIDRGNYRIALVDMRSSVTQVLTRGQLDESPSFAPNGRTIIYATREGNQGVLATVSTDGRIQQRLASTLGEVREPVWSPFPSY